MSTNFRFRLKQEMQAKHDELDRQVSALDLGRAEQYALYLSLHHVCFHEMARAVAPSSPSHALLKTFVQHLASDLLVLGFELPRCEVTSLGVLDPLAARYVIEGSRLGSRILRDRWILANDEKVLRAGSYLSLAAQAGAWRDVCEELATLPPDSNRAKRIEADTSRIFDMFLGAHASLKKTEARGSLAAP